VKRRIGLGRIHPRPRSALLPTRRVLPATDELGNLPAARNVVSDDRKATIWPDSRARVRTRRSTPSQPESADIHTYLVQCWYLHEAKDRKMHTGHSRSGSVVDVDRRVGSNTMQQQCRPERRHFFSENCRLSWQSVCQ
jgi:hypothetical protein